MRVCDGPAAPPSRQLTYDGLASGAAPFGGAASAARITRRGPGRGQVVAEATVEATPRGAGLVEEGLRARGRVDAGADAGLTLVSLDLTTGQKGGPR